MSSLECWAQAAAILTFVFLVLPKFIPGRYKPTFFRYSGDAQMRDDPLNYNPAYLPTWEGAYWPLYILAVWHGQLRAKWAGKSRSVFYLEILNSAGMSMGKQWKCENGKLTKTATSK